MIYIYMTLFAVVFAYYSVQIGENYDNTKIENNLSTIIVKNGLFFCSFLTIFIPGAIRYFVGIDYSTYTYLQIPRVLSGVPVKVEPLYRLVIYLGNWLGQGVNYQPIFVITNFIIVAMLFLYVKQQSKNIPFSIYIFMTGGFFAFSLSGMRQSIGVIIALFCLKYIKEKKLIQFVIGIIIAALFHTSVLIFLLFYPVHKIKISPFIVLIAMLFIDRLAGFFRNLIMYVSEKFGIYSDYFGGVFDNGQYGRLQVYIVLLVMIFLCLSRLFLGKEKFYSINDELHIHYMASLVVSMISVIPTPSRLLFLFIPVYITLIPNLVVLYKNKKYRIFIYFGIILIFGFVMYRNIYVQNTYQILPYKDIFSLQK